MNVQPLLANQDLELKAQGRWFILHGDMDAAERALRAYPDGQGLQFRRGEGVGFVAYADYERALPGSRDALWDYLIAQPIGTIEGWHNASYTSAPTVKAAPLPELAYERPDFAPIEIPYFAPGHGAPLTDDELAMIAGRVRADGEGFGRTSYTIRNGETGESSSRHTPSDADLLLAEVERLRAWILDNCPDDGNFTKPGEADADAVWGRDE